MTIQSACVLALVLLATFYLLKDHLRPSSGCGSGCGSCKSGCPARRLEAVKAESKVEPPNDSR